jgi:L-fuconolactonase
VSGAQILDSHHHLWDTNALEYELFEKTQPLQGRYGAAEFEAEAALHGIERSICVEAASAGADGGRETEWLLRQLGGSSRVCGIVAWAPLERPELEQYLDRLLALRGKRIVGVRRSFEFEDSEFPRRLAVTEGARTAGARGLVVDLVLFNRSLPATIALVDACPETQFVLDHLGKPSIRARVLEPWASQLRELARRPNVVCKLSGLPTEADRANWTTADLAPYVEVALESFGHERLLYGSDWPVVNLAGGAGRWFAAVRKLLADLDEIARHAVLGANAARVYKLA